MLFHPFQILTLLTFSILSHALPKNCVTTPHKPAVSTVTVTTPNFPTPTTNSTTPTPGNGNGINSFGTCARNHKIACCNQKPASPPAGGNTVNNVNNGDGLLGNILGGSCALSSAVGGMCRGSDTFCCPTNQNGEINVSMGCSPILLKLR